MKRQRRLIGYAVMVAFVLVDFGFGVYFARFGYPFVATTCVTFGLVLVAIIVDCVRLDRAIDRLFAGLPHD